MPLLYSVVARGTTILAKHANCTGNFQEVLNQILPKIPPEDSKLTYSHGSYLFHYIMEGGIIYLCISDDDFERSRAFLFLNEVKKRFQMTYGSRVQTALPYAMNSEFSRVLANEMRHFSDARDDDTIAKVQGELDELKHIMVQNIDSLASRGERLELLVNKAENLSASSVTFRTTSRTLARTLWWKNVKMMVIAVLIGIVALYIIVSIACGGLDWKKCVKKKQA
ncbi:unnamed protein product [Darwinula stevensoni]|uniref:Vesicle-associated membrane protein 7 n=1 Tax=Darwinula stevensoni TaxID=69355 RepID=A0A7R8X226_9CRUS|nr:unnamed protein product [Darwinula stevensoni]CAG0882805.1 unnamed protein product [Darwinula stevensoni]